MIEGRRYRIIKPVGKGGFGYVYQADLLGPEGFTKTVALKILHADASDLSDAAIVEVAKRLRDEARMLGLLSHRAIVQVDGLVKLGGRWAVVMEYVEGMNLSTILVDGPVPVGAALEIMGEVAGALSAAYDRKGPDGRQMCLLHRDLKPSNIRITPEGEVKVLDFGIAQADFEGRESETQLFQFGSVDYLSPERLDYIDSAAGDIYSLGVVLFEMITAVRYGKTSSDRERHQKKLDGAIAYLREELGDSDATDDLLALVIQMLGYNREDRPNARQLVRRFQDLRVQYGGPWLTDWARKLAPRYTESELSIEDDDLTGMVMVEEISTTALPGRSSSVEGLENPSRLLSEADFFPKEPIHTARGDLDDAHVRVAARRPVSQLEATSPRRLWGIAAVVLLHFLVAGVLLGATGWFQPTTVPQGEEVELHDDVANATIGPVFWVRPATPQAPSQTVSAEGATAPDDGQ